jgi:hypothetical protein
MFLATKEEMGSSSVLILIANVDEEVLAFQKRDLSHNTGSSRTTIGRNR